MFSGRLLAYTSGMQQSAALIFATLTLAVPGPTNALLAVAGTAAGLRRAAHLALVAVLGYGIAVLVLVHVAAPIVAEVPFAGRVLRLAAAAVLVQVALTLWRMPSAAGRDCRPVGWGHVFATTLLNPKALVLAMLVMPEDAPVPFALRPETAVLPVLAAAVSLMWIAIGSAMRANSCPAKWIERGGAIVLSSFAAIITVSALR